MLKRHSLESKQQAPGGNSGTWYELKPGRDDGTFASPDAAFFWIDEWELVAEPLLADRLPGYDRHGRVMIPEPAWNEPLNYLDDLCRRLELVEEPALIHVLTPDLPQGLRHEVCGSFPGGRDRLLTDLRQLVVWCRSTLQEWQAITVIGL